jgi:hypothetical protein
VVSEHRLILDLRHDDVPDGDEKLGHHVVSKGNPRFHTEEWSVFAFLCRHRVE